MSKFNIFMYKFIKIYYKTISQTIIIPFIGQFELFWKHVLISPKENLNLPPPPSHTEEIAVQNVSGLQITGRGSRSRDVEANP